MKYPPLFSLEGKTAVITGGSGVLGRIMALAMAEAGARVAVLGRSKEKLQAVVKEIEEAGSEGLALAADVTETTQLKEVHAQLLQVFGTPDILVNAAGGNISGATIGPNQSILELSEADLRKVVELNYIGTVLPTQVFGQSMMKRKKGNIINISSLAAQRPLTRVMGYASSKAAIDNYTKWLAVELAQKYGEEMRVNAIAPGFFLTEQNRTLLTEEDGSLSARGKQIIDHTPFGRFGNPEDLSGTLIWLCSDASRFVTGTIIPVDGGFNAYSGV
ncbi:SDR family oxidoreductase [Nafulsella turpanensis]|uniref:SDR family oxidoreductase n=1 Tax=Nafulsella turpanensis TaxID=1265690 RepID=UPI00034B294C|nr:SDR family oxidoreductase [Nafulsella turpanensis]